MLFFHLSSEHEKKGKLVLEERRMKGAGSGEKGRIGIKGAGSGEKGPHQENN